MTFKIFIKKLKHKADLYLSIPHEYRSGKEMLARLIDEKDSNEIVFVNRNPIGQYKVTSHL